MADPIPHFDVTVHPETLKDDVGPMLKVIRPNWSLEQVKLSASTLDASGGLINPNIRCYVPEDKSNAVIVRIQSSKLNEIYERSNEVKALKARAKSRPVIEHVLNANNKLQLQFIGRSFYWENRGWRVWLRLELRRSNNHPVLNANNAAFFKMYKTLFYFQRFEFSPRLLATFNNGFCHKVIKGEVLRGGGGNKMRQEAIWRPVAEQLAAFHSGTYCDDTINKEGGRLSHDNLMGWQLNLYPSELMKCDPFVNERFLKELPPKEALEKEYYEILAHADATGSPIVLCHYDLKPENIIWNSETGKVYFVDFETVNYHPQAWDIALHFNRFSGLNPPDYTLCPDDDFKRMWLRVYFRKYNELTGKKQNGVTDHAVERLLMQVKKYNLVLLLESVYAGAALWAMDDTAEFGMNLNGEILAMNSFKEYLNTKDSTLALELPTNC